MLGVIPEGRIPAVGVHNSDVGIWSMADGEPHGLIMSPLAAIETGLKLIGVGGEQSRDGGCVINPSAVAIEAAEHPVEECAARLLITIEGANIGIELTAMQLVEITAALVAVSNRNT